MCGPGHPCWCDYLADILTPNIWGICNSNIFGPEKETCLTFLRRFYLKYICKLHKLSLLLLHTDNPSLHICNKKHASELRPAVCPWMTDVWPADLQMSLLLHHLQKLSQTYSHIKNASFIFDHKHNKVLSLFAVNKNSDKQNVSTDFSETGQNWVTFCMPPPKPHPIACHHQKCDSTLSG